MKLKGFCLFLILVNLGCASKPVNAPEPKPIDFARQPASAPTDKNFASLHTDLRDLALYTQPFAATAKLILSSFKKNPLQIKGDSDQGPSAIISVEFEKISEVAPPKVYDFDVLIFLNNKTGYFFRRLAVRVDWSKPKAPVDQRVQVTQFIDNIPLQEANFVATVDIFSTKLILVDESLKIWKVFPVQVGALDIRTQTGMDGKVVSLTKELPSAKLKRVLNTQNAGPQAAVHNTRNRITPKYYRGRPYLSVYTNGDRDHEAPSDKIAIAASPVPSGFISGRGFASHGTIRLNDRDLYQLDTILNEGSQQEMEIRIVSSAPEFELLDHPMPRADWYYALLYSNKPTSQNLVCKKDETESKMVFQSAWHTQFDSDCHAWLERVEKPVKPILDYVRGLTNETPKGPVQMQ